MAIEHKDIAAIREDYAKGTLLESDVDKNPFHQFKSWFDQAIDAAVVEPNAMVLATVDADGFPSSRIVLLKDIKATGFSFFTNYESKKAMDMAYSAQVSLLFFWPELQRQVRVLGTIEKLPAEDSDAYYASRPKGSRIGAWASPQSQFIPNRNFIEERFDYYAKQYAEQEDIPRPLHWGGYIVKPIYFEFWQGRSSRMHDRLVYVWEQGDWQLNRLAP
ncbi:pyridoxamine 5'-phosphate oxidase [Sphingobacterium sp. Mn56C]|uniref:pyridoxamine 5'-phosphate oxidase n=1 Tax=Sphingobacterium sp. Mn56C TaxID=3395261 RepID=UPI003BCC82AC